MGKRNSQRNNAAAISMMDSEDDNSSITSSSSLRSDQMSVLGNEEIELNKVVLLDQTLDALYEKRGSTREKALEAIIQAFSTKMQYEFVESKFASLLHPCLNSLKKGSSKEICLASRVIGLLSLTVGCGDKAREILDEAITPISQSLKSGSDPLKTAALMECLAIITFVGVEHPEQTEKSMQIMWQFVHPKLSSNVVAVKPSAAVITAMVSAWSFLLTTMNGWSLNAKDWQGSISYLSTLLDKDDRSVRIAAGEALALIFEMGSLEKFSSENNKGSSDSSFSQEEGNNKSLTQLRGLRSKIINQVRDLATEAGGKGSNKKDLNNQRNLFRDITEFLEDGYSPKTSVKIGGDSLHTSTWSELIQLNFTKHFLAGGFVKHMQDNELLHDVFGFTPKKKGLHGIDSPKSSSAKVGRNSSTRIYYEQIKCTYKYYSPQKKNIKFQCTDLHHVPRSEKRMYKSPNSILNKARTQFLNKQRLMVEGRNVGHFAAADGGEDM